MAPAVGPVAAKTIIIEKNDNAEGIIQFQNASVTGRFAHLTWTE
jgi:hypothetical protein